MVCPRWGGAGQPRTVVHASHSARHETGERYFPLPSPGLRGRGSSPACPVTEPRPSGKNGLRVRRSAMRPLSGRLWQARCRRLAPSVRSPLLARMLVQPGHHRWHGARLLAEIRRSSLPLFLSSPLPLPHLSSPPSSSSLLSPYPLSFSLSSPPPQTSVPECSG